MNNFISAFSFYEFLRILLPGAYLLVALKDLFDSWRLSLDIISDDSYGVLLSVILIFLMGLFIYSWDFPKMLKRFQKDLPTNKISNELELDDLTISNSYFSFYNRLPNEDKLKTEKYSGFFHLAVNFTVICLLIFATGVVGLFKVPFSEFQIINIIVFVISIFTAYLIYKKRLRYAFQRHLKEYLGSEEYRKLIEAK